MPISAAVGAEDPFLSPQSVMRRRPKASHFLFILSVSLKYADKLELFFPSLVFPFFFFFLMDNNVKVLRSACPL